MNEEAKKIALEYLQKLLQGLEKGIDFAGGQMPFVAQEIVTYGRFYSTLSVIGGLIIGLAGIILYKRLWIYTEGCKDKSDTFLLRVLATIVIGGVFGGISSCLIVSNFDTCVKSLVAPRLYLIEYLRSIIK